MDSIFIMLPGDTDEVEIRDISIGPAEPDVGIMSAYVDGYSVFDGEVDITEDLDEEDHDLIVQKIMDIYYEGE